MSQIGCPFQQRISVQEVETEIKKSKLTEKNFKKVENSKGTSKKVPEQQEFIQLNQFKDLEWMDKKGPSIGLINVSCTTCTQPVQAINAPRRQPRHGKQ